VCALLCVIDCCLCVCVSVCVVSEAPAEVVKPQKYENFHEYSAKYKTDEQKKDEVWRGLL